MNFAGPTQHIGMNGNAVPQRRFAQVGQIANIVAIFEEARLAVVPPLNDVLRNPGEIGAWLAWHRD